MKITVTHVGAGVQDVSRPTPLGNPFFMKDESQRGIVCDKYEAWFKAKVDAKDTAVMSELRKLWRIGSRDGVLNLGCRGYCAPRRCHAETIAAFLNSHQKQEH